MALKGKQKFYQQLCILSTGGITIKNLTTGIKLWVDIRQLNLITIIYLSHQKAQDLIPKTQYTCTKVGDSRLQSDAF